MVGRGFKNRRKSSDRIFRRFLDFPVKDCSVERLEHKTREGPRINLLV